MSKGGKDADNASKGGDDTMRGSYHFTNTLGSGDISVATKLEGFDEVESEEKVSSVKYFALKLIVQFLIPKDSFKKLKINNLMKFA